MSDKKPLRALFCIGVSQNFFDATPDEAKNVWGAFGSMLKTFSTMPGVRIVGTIDDDQIMVGPSTTPPWTAYILADVPDFETAAAVCNLFRATPVGDGTFKLWKYARVECRLGRELAIPA